MYVVWRLHCENCEMTRSYSCGNGMLDYGREGRKSLFKSLRKEKRRTYSRALRRHELYYCPNCKKLSFCSIPFLRKGPEGVRKIKHCRDCKGEMDNYHGEPFICDKCGHLNGQEGTYLLPAIIS